MLIETFDWRWWLAGLLLLLVAIEAYLRSQPIYRAARHIPGVFVWPLIANSLEGLKLINNGRLCANIIQCSIGFTVVSVPDNHRIELQACCRNGEPIQMWISVHIGQQIAILANTGPRGGSEYIGVYFVNQYFYTLRRVQFLFNSSKNSDKSSYYRFLLPVLGEGLLLSNGAKWAHRRKILTPAFHFNILQKFLDTFKCVFCKESISLILSIYFQGRK